MEGGPPGRNSEPYAQPFEYSVHDEKLESLNGTLERVHINYGIDASVGDVLRPLEVDAKVARDKAVTYIYESPPKSEVIYGGSSKLVKANRLLRMGTKNPTIDGARILKGPTGICRKLYRAGGDYSCRNSTEEMRPLDGHKYICLDPELQVISGSRNTSECLVLSFGVYLDISFDIVVRDMNCEVLMFDIDYYDPPNTKGDPYVKFFETGLSYQREMGYSEKKNKSIYLGDLETLSHQYGFADRLINILKIDIEGEEWKVLRQLAKSPYLNYVAQIALEVHGMHLDRKLLDMPTAELVQIAGETFKLLQDRGFQRISYFDNFLAPKKVTENTTIYSAGELLLVNSNWYNEHFRKEGSQFKLNFRPL